MAGCCLLWLVVSCCGWLLLVAVAGCCCFIFLIRRKNILLFIYDDMLIYLQSLLLLCCAAILLTLILTLCLRSNPLLPSQTACLATFPNPTNRPVLILSQNVMPMLLTSVITRLQGKPITPHKLKESLLHQILVTTMGYILANYSFCTGRIEPFNTVIMNIISWNIFLQV